MSLIPFAMPRTRKKGRTTKKNKASALDKDGTDEQNAAPHSFVVHRGIVGKAVQELTRDWRRVMEPFTASNIKVRPKNVIKDFVHVAGALHVSHMCSFTKTELGPYIKLSRFPRGPTLTFKINDYTLARDVRSSLKRQVTYEKQFLNHALLILNGFTTANINAAAQTASTTTKTPSGKEMELMASMFQNLFPSINVTKVKLNGIRRCVLLNYDAEKDSVEMRHYTIKVVPVGLSRSVKKLVQGKVPNLSRFDDVSQYLDNREGNASESEAEDDETSRVTMPQGVTSRGNLAAQQSSVRLVELGPRMNLELIKIEEGLHDGEVLYHKLVEKTEAEKEAIRANREKKKRQKTQRTKEQERNVRRKEEEKRVHKKKSWDGMKLPTAKAENLPAGFKSGPDQSDSASAESDDDNDAEWYRKEVGEKPDKDLFAAQRGMKRKSSGMPPMGGR